MLGCITVLMAVFGGVVSAHAPSKTAHKVASIIGFVILGIGAVVYTVKLSREQAEAASTMTTLVAKVAAATLRTENLEATNAAQNQQIIDLSKRTAELAQKGIDTATGGESFCYAGLSFQFGAAIPVVIQQGNYPIYGVSARISDISKARREQLQGKQNVDLSSDINIFVGDLAVQGTWSGWTRTVAFSETQFQSFNIFFNGRNGFWTEQLRLKKVNGRWESALKVTGFRYFDKRNNVYKEKALFEQKSDQYPRQRDGSINWTEDPYP